MRLFSLEFNDEHGAGITLRSLARPHRASGDSGLPAALANKAVGDADG